MSNNLVPYFTGRRLKDVIVETPKDRVSITYKIYEEWEDVFSATLMCGNKQSKSYITRIGVSKTDQLKLSTLLECEAGLPGALKIKGSSTVSGTVEHTLQTMQEQTHSFDLEAPEYGKKITSLYQLKNVIEIHYEERSRLPWSRPTVLHRTITSWQKRFDDQTRIIDPHPDCAPPDYTDTSQPPPDLNLGAGSPVQIDLGNGLTFTGDMTATPDGLGVPELGLLISTSDAAQSGRLAMDKSQLPNHLTDLVEPSEESLSLAISPYTPPHELTFEPETAFIQTFEAGSLYNPSGRLSPLPVLRIPSTFAGSNDED